MKALRPDFTTENQRRIRRGRFLNLESLEPRLLLATFTVTSTNDTGAGSLREAITSANTNPGTDTIQFAIGTGAQTIQPKSALPTIMDPVVIDATTQPGFSGMPLIELDGSQAGNANGIRISSGGSTVRGLVLNRLQQNGILLETRGNNTIEGNFIGTDVTGTLALGNSESGVRLGNSPDNIIGGPAEGDRNIISGNRRGVYLSGGDSSGNVIQGNYIGLDVSGGTDAFNLRIDANTGITGPGNQRQGIFSEGASATRILDNVISANGSSGLEIHGPGRNIITGNYIGTDANGAKALPNSDHGIDLREAAENRIGGLNPTERNVISGNRGQGISISGTRATSNTIVGNLIGADANGERALGNSGDGIAIFGASNNIVGGTTDGARNVISGNRDDGVQILGTDATGNRVEGNFIGTDESGENSIGNSDDGVFLTEGASDNLIGGISPGQGNTIAFNGGDGVDISPTSNTTGNAIRGNSMFANDELGIDVHPNGSNANDPSDSDTGVNQRQNFPELQNVSLSSGTLDIAYHVPSDPANSAFPLQVDFYVADDDGRAGRTYLGTDAFSTADFAAGGASAMINQGTATDSELIVATATDAKGNTSEFSGPTAITPVVVTDRFEPNDSFPQAADLGTGDQVHSALSLHETGNNDWYRWKASGDGQLTVIVAFTHSEGDLDVELSDSSQTLLDASQSNDDNEQVATRVTTGKSYFIRVFGFRRATNPDYAVTLNFELDANVFTVTNTNDTGVGSLREAINNANANPAEDTIRFAIGTGVQTIQPKSALPTITDPVIIDATTQPGFSGMPLIELDGTQAGNVNGIVISAGGSIVRGLVINRFSQCGILLEINGDNKIEGNFIGTDVTGTLALGNSESGICLRNTPRNTIGGPAEVTRNIISGNLRRGVYLGGAASLENVIQGNYIGLDVSGGTGVGNQQGGVFSEDGAASENRDVNTKILGNVIASNGQNGISIHGPGRHLIAGNKIGTDATGTRALGNTNAGIGLRDAAENIIGGRDDNSRNIISGNRNEGIVIAGPSATSNVIMGNYIGTDADGTVAVGTQGDGVFIAGAPGNIVGGTVEGARNVISGSSDDGIDIRFPDAIGNVVQGNYIGTDSKGTNSISFRNGANGINVAEGAAANTIGGTTSATRNVISGNRGNGIAIRGLGTSANVVQGNFIGTDFTGMARLGNGQNGVLIEEAASDNTIGGRGAGEGNTIAFSSGDGVNISSSSAGNSIRGNSMFSNNDLGIDVAPNGSNANDPSDSDTGANRRQNFPQLENVTLGSGTLDITYRVPSATANSTYPLQVDFFIADADGQEGKTFLGTDEFSVADSSAGGKTVGISQTAAVEGDQIVATATDADGNSSEFSPARTVVMATLNEPPRITSFNVPVVLERTATVIVVTASDPEGGILSYSISGGADATQFSINPTTGLLTFNTAPEFESPADANLDNLYEVEVQATDDRGATDTELLAVIVIEARLPQIDAIPDLTIIEDSGVTSVALTGISAGEGPATSLVLSATSNNQDVVPNPSVGYTAPGESGILSFAPLADQNGIATITVNVTDAGADGLAGNDDDGQAFQSFTVTVLPVNDPPSARDDFFSVGRNSRNNILDVLGNDTIAPDVGETLSIFGVLDPSNGSVQIAADGRSLGYTPDDDFTGADGFTYVISDGARVDVASATITVSAARLEAGDANEDFRFDQFDVIQVAQSGKYLTGQPATWAEGDWNGAPGGRPGAPPVGDGLFNQFDIIAAQLNGLYLQGPYATRRPMVIQTPDTPFPVAKQARRTSTGTVVIRPVNRYYGLVGDANADSGFNQDDLRQVMSAGKYLTDRSALWSDGDWNGDGVFDQLDIVRALQLAHYAKNEKSLYRNAASTFSAVSVDGVLAKES